MAKQLNVNLAFSADTSKVKGQLQDLQNQLKQLTMSTNIDLGITGDIKEATKAAAELSVHLKQATNVQTGTLDFTKLNQSITSSGKSLQQYGQTLASMGPKGQQAFMSLAQAVASSEVPIRRTNAMLKEMGTTLANTARWQLSSSILHGFMGAVQSAYGYAQDLNESLNNIRIVTGQNIDQMSRFAEEANKAARALSTTTTEYTNASLIYYQQGLNDQQVKERTDVTIKMANVARQSAEVVSDQMTAIWNNFYDGSKSLEHYADVMTALGAATASSTDEIAGGLEKFAAIGQTIGLSYEYAASALATITSNTRQSEEVVGTALKTIFARIQGLNLGETLDDGTTLNKYSEALNKVGISIFDQQGELKKMDTILDEMGAKWDTLNKSQQVALAQTVAGVRQYNQLISLMDNWDKGDSDSFQANLLTANTSTGALQKQADIYAESWEAAQDRVRAAAEGVYQALINDEFFIDMLNSIEKVIGFVDHLIDNLGGLKGVLSAIGAIVTRIFSDQIAQGITNMAYNISMMTESGRKKVQQQKSDFIADASTTLANMEGGSSTVQTTASQAYTEQLTLQQKMIDNADKMTEAEQQTVQLLMDQLKARGEAAIAQAKELDAAKKVREETSEKLYVAAAKKAQDSGVKFDSGAAAKELGYIRASVEATRELDAALDGVTTSGEATEQNANDIYNIFVKLQGQLGKGVITQEQLDGVQQLLIKLQNVDAESEDFEATLQSLRGLLGAIDAGVIDGASSSLGANLDDVRAYADSINKTADAQRNLDQANEEVKQSSETVGQTIDNARGKQQTWADILVSSANFAFTAASALNMLGGAFDKLKDPDVSGWDKFLTILTTLGMVVPTLVSLFGTFKKLLSSETIAKLANVAATLAQVMAEKKLNKEKGTSTKVTKENIKQTMKDTKEKLTNSVKNKGKSIKDTWNQNALAKNANYTKTKSGAYTVKGTKGFVSADKAATMAGKEALGAVGKMAGGVALIAAGVMVAVGAVKWGIAQYNKQAKAAQEAAEAANKAAEAYQHVAEAYNSFTSTMDNYTNAKAGLEELTKGTNEYREAVLKANEAAMELINNNEGLQYTVDNDGLIQINEESLKAVQEKKLDQMQNAQISSQLAAQNAKNKQLESDRTDFARESLHSGAGIGAGVGNTLAATGAGAGAGALIGAGIGTIVPVIGNAVGAAVGAVVGGIAGLITGIVGSATAGASVDPEQQALEKLARVYEKEGNARFADDESFKAMLSEQGITDPLLIQSLTENRQSTMELVAKMAENTAAISSMNEQMVASEFGDELSAAFDKFYSSADDGTAAAMTKETTEAMAVQLEKRSAELYEDEYKDQFGGMTDADIQKQYAEAMGWDVDKTENKNGNKATYYDKDGNVVAEDLSDEVARQFLAQQAALKELEGSMPFYIDAVQSLANAGNALGDGIGTAIASFAGGDGGNLNTLTQSQFEAASSAELTAKKDEDGNVISFTYNGEVIDDEKAQLLGYESAAAFYDAFNAEIKRVENAWEEIELDFEEAGLDPKIVEDLSLEAAQKFQKSLEKMNYGSLGDQGAKAYADGIDMISESLNMGEADVAQFVEGLSDIDWSDWYAMDDVNALLESMGYDLDMTTEEMQEFIATMREVGGASPADALRRTWENAALLSDKLSEGIAPGSVLDKDTYAALIQENAALEDQFMQMMDGTYKYVGDDTLDFSNAMNLGETLEQTKEMSDLYENAKEAASEINFAGLANMDFVSADEIEEASDALDEAAAAADKAQEEMDGFHPIKHKEYEAALNTANANEASAEQHLENLEEQRASDLADAQAAVEAVMNNDYLKDVAEYNGWDEDTLNAMLEGIKNGDDAAMEQMKVFAGEMNKFMAAGDEGLYDVSAAEEKIASIATSIEELDELTEQYSLSSETYAKAITGLFASAASEAQSLEELDELKQKVLDAGGEVNNDVYLENVTRLSEEAMNAAESMDALAQAKYEAESRGADVDPELYTENIKRIAEESVNAASSMTELQEAWGKALATGTELDTSAYNEKLIELGSAYENCADEVKAFEQALLSNDPALVEEAKSLLEVAVELNELAEAYGLDAEATANYADRLADGNATTADAKRAFGQMAIAAQRLDRGVRNINDNLDDYKKVIKTANRDSFEFSETMDALKTDIADMFNVADGNMFSDTFAEALLDSEDFKKVLDGDVEALDRLRASATVDIGDNIIKQLGDAADTVHYKLDEAGNQIANSAYTASGAWDYVRSVLADGFTLEEINNEQFVNSLNDMISASGMTKEQIQSMLGSMGVSAEVVTDYKEMETEVPTYYERSVPDGVDTFTGIDMDGQVQTYTRPRIKKMTIPGKPEKVMGYVPTYSVKTTSGDSSSGGEIDYSNTFTKASPPSISSGSTSAGGSGGGGGGSSSPTKMEKRDSSKKSDTVERYREVSDAIDNVTDALTRAERATDRLWGKDKLKAMREENKILEEQRDLLLQKAEEAEEYAKEDAANLRKVAQDIGVSVVIDQNTGDITNIEDVEETLYNRLSAAEDEYNRKVEAYNAKVAQYGENPTQQQSDELEKMKDAIDAYETDVIGDIEKDISAWEDAEQQFQSSIEEWENAGLEAEEILDQIMQNNYDIIMEGLEIPLSLNEEDLRLIELQLSQIEDDVYSMAEAVALTSSQFGEYQDNLRLADEALAELNRAHEAGEITDAAYQEGLGEIRDKYYENVEALMELDNTMMDYYSNTIDMANEELSKYTDQIEHQTSVLEHYSSLIELMGKSSDYKMMGKVLEGQVKTTKDAMTVSKQWYETQRANADSLAAEYAAAQARGASDEELELIKKNWDAAEASANEAQDKMLSDAEAWAEALRAVLENKLADLGQTLENALTGGTSFDTINTQMERAQSLQEEYLTTTNQIYETNKLMRTAQQEIDKTTNSVAKKKLQAYIAETEQLQNQSKLSQYELDIQKAKYDLLLAEIALEEAQDAKSTVRLQRDSEGNFGYVYTADQNKLAEAQQQLEDAQNSLYNIGLEGANDYAQKYQQTMQEMYDTFADLQQQKLDGAFETEEEYHRAMEEAKAYYYQKLQDYSGLYSVAITTDSRVVADAWSSDFADMVYDTDEWMSAVDQYVADVELAFKEWSDAVHDPSTGITAIIGGDVHAVGEKVDEVTQKSADLAKTTTEKVIPALDAELDAVQNMTGAYAAMRQEIQAVIEEYTNMINRINNSQTNEWNSGDSGDGSGDGTGDGEGTGGEGSGNGSGDGTGDGEGTEGGGGEGAGGGQETGTDSYRYGTVEFRGNGADRIWIDEAGKQYAYNSSQGKALQTAFNKAFGRNGGYKGDYWIGWTDTGGKLKADILREKDGLATGGYTGEWAGSYGKLALLHQKELVLNASDTENLLTSMEVLNKIVEMIDLQSMSSQLGGLLNSPSLGLHSSEVLEQNVHIEASFPGVQDRSEIEEAFNNLINKASQFANRK